MGKFGWHSGYVTAQNLQAGTFTYTSGQETKSVTFTDQMRQTASVALTGVKSTSTVHFVDTQDLSGFTAKRDQTGAEVQVNWVAVDDTERN